MKLFYHTRNICRHNHLLDVFYGSCRYLSSACRFEKGIISAHMKLTQRGDRVVIIGGGDGRTAIAAANQVGPDGTVLIFEGGDRSYLQISRLLDAGVLSSACSVRHAVVGPLIDVYGGDCHLHSRLLITRLAASHQVHDTDPLVFQVSHQPLVFSPAARNTRSHPAYPTNLARCSP